MIQEDAATVAEIRSHFPAREQRSGRAEDGLVRAGCACNTTAGEVVDRLVEGVASLAR